MELTENGSLFSLVGKRQTVMDDRCFRKHVHLRSHTYSLTCLIYYLCPCSDMATGSSQLAATLLLAVLGK